MAEQLLAPLPGIAASVAGGLFLVCAGTMCLTCGPSALRLFSRCLIVGNVCDKRDENVDSNNASLLNNEGYELVKTNGDIVYGSNKGDSESLEVWVTPLVAFQHLNTVYTEDGVSSSRKPQLQFNDRWVALVFILNVVAVTSFAVLTCNILGLWDQMLQVIASEQAKNDYYTDMARGFGVCVTVAIIFGLLLLSVMIKFPEIVLRGFMFLGLLAIACGGSLAYYCTEEWLVLVLSAAVTLFALRYYSLSAKKIPFSSAVLGTAAAAIRTNFTGVMFVSALMLLVQGLWLAVCGIAYYGVSQYFSLLENRPVPWYLVTYFLLSFYWGAQVIKCVMQCTVCGVVGSWWFQPSCSSPVRGALLRSSTVLFGSACFGSLLVAAVQTLDQMISSLLAKKRKRQQVVSVQSIVGWIIRKILFAVESCLKYFNKYSFCYCAAYGTSFLDSGKRVSTLFKDRGWTAVISDNFVSITLTFCMVLTVVGASATGYFVGAYAAPLIPNADTYFALMGGFTAVAVNMVVYGVIESAVAMVFVCMAEGPRSLQLNHPDEYAALDYSWGLLRSGAQDWRLPPAAGAERQPGCGIFVAPAAVVIPGADSHPSVAPRLCPETYETKASASNSFSYL